MSVDFTPTQSGFDLSGGADVAHVPNGFEYLGVLYCFLTATGTTPAGDNKLHVMHSTDGGASWSELDAAHAPFIGLVQDFGNAYTVCHDGATVYALYVRAHHTFPPPIQQSTFIDGITVVKFNLTTGLWGLSTDYAAPVVDFMQQGNAIVSNSSWSAECQVNLITRGPGDMIFYYSGPIEAVPGTVGLGRCYYATFDGTNFGTGTELPSQVGSPQFRWPLGCVIGASGLVHFFEMDNTNQSNPPLGYNVFSVAMQTDGTFGTTQVVTPMGFWQIVAGSWSPFLLSGKPAIAGVVNDDLTGATQSVRIFYATDVLNPPVWGNTIVSDDQTTLPVPFFQDLQTYFLGASVAPNGILFVVWCWTDSSNFLTARVSQIYEAHTPISSLSFTAPAIAYTISLPFFPANQVTTFGYSKGVGVISAAEAFGRGGTVFGNEIATFDLLAAVATPVVNITTDGCSGGWECPVMQCIPPAQSLTRWGPVSLSKQGCRYVGIYRDSRGQVRQFSIDPHDDAIGQLAAGVMRIERAQVDPRANNPGRLLWAPGQVGEFDGAAVFATLDDGVQALKTTIMQALIRLRRETY